MKDWQWIVLGIGGLVVGLYVLHNWKKAGGLQGEEKKLLGGLTLKGGQHLTAPQQNAAMKLINAPPPGYYY